MKKNGDEEAQRAFRTPRDRILQQFPLYQDCEKDRTVPELSEASNATVCPAPSSPILPDPTLAALWDQAEVDRLVKELEEEINRIRLEVFQGTFPTTVENVLMGWLELAQEYQRDPWERIRRGYDPLSSLRRMKETIHTNVENWFACQQIARITDLAKGDFT
jgi:hypothetical protein